MSKRKRPNHIRSARYLFEYTVALMVYYTIRPMPLSWIYFISYIAGSIIIIVPPVRTLIIANLKIAFPDKDDCEIRRIARENMMNIILITLEFLWFAGRPEKLDALFDPAHDKYLKIAQECKDKGRGLIWVTPHLGNWELAGFQFKLKSGMPFAVVARPQNNPYMEALVSTGRESAGNRIIEDKGAVRAMIKALKDGCFIATLIDQNSRARDGGIFVDFFGLPASTSRAPAFFAKKLDVTIAVAGCLRAGKCRYFMFCEPLSRNASEYETEEEIIQEIMKINEGLIKKYPEQYLWLYKRWLYIPEDVDENKKASFPFYASPVTRKFYDRYAEKKESIDRASV